MGDLKAFQKDLRDGMTIEEGLKKHGLTFRQAFNPSGGMMRPSPCVFKGSIQKTANGKYQIKKRRHRVTRTYGTYNTLEEAEIVREELHKADWDFNQLPTILEQTGITKCPRRGRKVEKNTYIAINSSGNFYIQKRIMNGKKVIRKYAGTYHSIEDARVIRDELVKNNWDISKLDELCDKHGIKHYTRGRGR